MTRFADMAREPASMRRGTQGHVGEPCEPTRSSHGAMWRGRLAGATQVHLDAQVAPRGNGGWHLEGPGVSGPWL